MRHSLASKTELRFDVTSVLRADLSLDDEKWETARPLLLTPYLSVFKRISVASIESSALTYALSFASLSSVLVHVYIWHWGEIKEGMYRACLQEPTCLLSQAEI